MRIVFIGASQLTVMTARLLIPRRHDVVIIESDRDVIDTLSDELDCAFLHGDGSKPHLLREAGPKQTDVLFCLTDSDQANILAALIGRSLGFEKVVPSIRDPELMSICQELGLEHTVVPDQTIGRYLADAAAGVDILELSTLIKGEARFFSFEATEKTARRVGDLELPERARAICFYRDGEFNLADEDTRLRAGDEIVILTHSKHLAELRERWEPGEAGEEPGD
jgi:trk system potassium uptake protein TrkA